MPRRLQPSLIDYLVIAINPALIMVLIGSVVYFLLEMYYQGQYPERLHFCLTLFIFSAVLIARISMEEGWEHAAPFGVALAVAICLAMHKFVSYRGTQLAEVGWLINYGLIALASWCAYKLTWDCTLIDESQDASGEGLLQTAGLDSPQSEVATDPESTPSARSKSAKPPPLPLDQRAAADAESISPTDPETPADESLFARFVRRRRRPHAPGLWVVYFSLAALLLFGLGQASIPLANTASRRYSFVLLCIYVACALGLLSSTSFLGLRRYLRQRRLEMPASMAATWLITGGVLIVCMLCVTALLPRSNAEYLISQLPSTLTSEQHDSSKVSAGSEGVRDEHASSARGEPARPDEKNSRSSSGSSSSGSQQSQQNSGNSKAGSGKAGSKSDGEKSGESKSTGSKSGNSTSGGSKSGDSKSADSKSNASKPTNAKSESAKSDSAKSASSSSAGSKPTNSKTDRTASSQPKPNESKTNESKPNESKPDKSASGSSKPTSSKSWEPPGTPPPPNLSLAGQLVADLIKWVFYSALAGLFLWWLLFHWRVLLEWLQALLGGWQGLWGRWFRREPDAADAAPIAPRRKRFADYSDPFATGVAGRYPPVELVRYSFEALEAWARDNGLPREPDQTVYEFARQIALQVEELGAQAQAMADLYSWAAYAPQTLPASSMDRLREFWQTLLRVDRNREPARATANS